MLYQKESWITQSICLDLPLQQFSIHRAASRREGDLAEILLLWESSGHPSWPATEIRPRG